MLVESGLERVIGELIKGTKSRTEEVKCEVYLHSLQPNFIWYREEGRGGKRKRTQRNGKELLSRGFGK